MTSPRRSYFGHDGTERLLIGWAGVGERRGAISAKYRSNPTGEIISNARAGASLAFQKACGTPLGLKTRSPGRATRTWPPT